MQKLVTELNQIAAKRDAQSRAPKARSWGGDGPPNLNSVPPLLDDHQAIEEWMCEKLRSAGCPRVWICGRHLAGVEHAGTRSIKNGDIEQRFRTQSMDVQTALGNRMCAVIDAADTKRRCLDGGGH